METGDAPARPRRLTRSSRDRVIAGVAGGLGAHTGLDPIIFRIGFVALALTGGLGILLYVLGALFIPREDGSSGGNGGLALAILAGLFVLFGGAALAGALVTGLPLIGDPVFAARHFFDLFGSTVVIALALIAIGYLLLREDRRPDRLARGGAPSERKDEPPPPAAVETSEDAPSGVRRPPSTLPWLTLAALLVVSGAIAALDNAGVTEPRAAIYPAAALGVTGLGLLVAARWGRGKWMLIPLGLLLLPPTVLASATDLPLTGRVGSFFAYAADASDLEQRYEVLAGELYLDLAPLAETSEDLAVEVRMVAGALSVVVPEGMGVDVEGSIDAGVYENHLRGGSFRDGLEIVVDESIAARPGFGTVAIDFRQGMGRVVITRSGDRIGPPGVEPYHPPPWEGRGAPWGGLHPPVEDIIEAGRNA